MKPFTQQPSRPHTVVYSPKQAKPIQSLNRQSSVPVHYDLFAWQKRYETVLANSGHFIYEWNVAANTITYVGDLKSFLGYSPKKIDRNIKNWIRRIHVFDRNRYKQTLNRALATHTPFTIEYRLDKNDGAISIVRDIGSVFMNPAGKLDRVISFVSNITDHDKEIKLLREREKRYRELVESQQELIMRVDPSGRFTFVNDAYCKKFGKSRNELTGTTFRQLIHKEDLPAMVEIMKGLELPPYRVYIEQRALTSQGWRWIAWEDYAIKNDKGQTVEIQAIGRDITERKLAEEKLKNRTDDLEVAKNQLETEKAQDEALLTSIGDGMIATDNDGNITLLNKAAEQMLGWKLEEVIEKPVSDIIKVKDEKGEYVEEAKRPTALALASGKKTIAATYFYVRKDGTAFPAEITITPVLLNQKIIGTIGVFRDITKEMEIDRAKSEFVTLASHQLRTPLSTVSWYAEALLKRYIGPLSQQQKTYLEEIYHATERMITLVNNFLNVSRIELNTFASEPRPVMLPEIARSVLAELEPDIKEKILTIHETYASPLPHIHTDPNHMRIIFQNLLTNAIKYTPRKGTIRLEIAKQRANIIIKLTDTGYGIPQSQQSKIFTKLFRADNVKGKDTTGTGLGLYIVKSILTQSKGKIWFESKEMQGTTFYISIPVNFTEISNIPKEL